MLVVGLVIRSYLNGKRDAALRSYDEKVSTIASDEAQISGPLFKVLATRPRPASRRSATTSIPTGCRLSSRPPTPAP